MTMKDEKGQMGFHFLPSFALNCDHRYDDDPDDDHDDNCADGKVSIFGPFCSEFLEIIIMKLVIISLMFTSFISFKCCCLAPLKIAPFVWRRREEMEGK